MKLKTLFIVTVFILMSAITSFSFQDNDFTYENGKLISQKDNIETYLPTKPEVIPVNILGTKMNCYQSFSDDGVFNVFVHRHLYISKSNASSYLSNLYKESLRVFKNVKILYSRTMECEGMPALKSKAEFEADGINFYKESLLMLGGNKTYSMSILYPKANSETIKSDKEKMFDSFKLLKKPDKSGRYVDENNDFSIIFPNGWDIEQRDHNKVIAWCPSQDDGYRPRIAIAITKNLIPLDLEAAFKSTIASIKMFSGDNVIEEGEMAVNSNKAKWAVMLRKDDKHESKSIVYEFVRNRDDFTIFCYATADQFQKYKPIFDETVKSFRFE
ncbi:MAG: hypothetical protein KKB81_07175 [Candidatus Margulisbacteria bacterium]|nr:hypothetical protein [Candidatus Margulisiibacteriota bacterium]MBU1022337.1 hypothetical protein [Candidatus Margulisiibacteriota bacterium]MBU1728403.1 hypothetical protein [Candidatus Margulisiibacteriota bacterium]MBU1955234.1 hypothetical protein [Candidatus Margulisiibacteriota bacterium]